MNEEPEILTAEQEQAREALRSMQTPAPDPQFRAQLKASFVDGTIEAAAPVHDTAPPRAAAGRRASLLDWLRGSLWGRMAWAAATAAIVLTVLTLNRGPQWELTAAEGEGMVTVNDRTVSMADTEALAQLLVPGVQVRVPSGAMLELRSAGQLAIRLIPGTEATIPSVPGRWFGRTASARVFSGTMRVTSGRGFKGARLTVATPIAEVEMTGTTMAVICEPEGTCVCVLEGMVKIGERGGEMSQIDAGHRRYVFNDGRPSVTADIRDTETMKLSNFRDEIQAKL